jgi:cell division protein ZipA
MEWLRWVLLGVGVSALVAIAWVYLRHKSEHAVELGSGRTQANLDDPIDAQIRHQAIDEPLSAARVVAEPQAPEPSAFEPPAQRAEPRLHATSSDSPPDIEPFVVEPEPLRWQQPTFTRRSGAPDLFAHPDDTDAARHTDTDGVIGAVRRTVLDAPVDTASASSGQGGLFRQRQAPRFSYQEKQASPAAGADRSVDAPKTDPAPAVPSAPLPVVIPLFVASLDGTAFPGAAVEELIEDMGFEFGALSIFHYHSELGEPLFSLMNGVNPGTFDRGNAASFATPVLALFMQVPLGTQSETLILDRMIDIARDLADHLGGTVLDDAREPLSCESIDRYREKLSS